MRTTNIVETRTTTVCMSVVCVFHLRKTDSACISCQAILEALLFFCTTGQWFTHWFTHIQKDYLRSSRLLTCLKTQRLDFFIFFFQKQTGRRARLHTISWFRKVASLDKMKTRESARLHPSTCGCDVTRETGSLFIPLIHSISSFSVINYLPQQNKIWQDKFSKRKKTNKQNLCDTNPSGKYSFRPLVKSRRCAHYSVVVNVSQRIYNKSFCVLLLHQIHSIRDATIDFFQSIHYFFIFLFE